MFERFTDGAKAVVHGAQLEAQARGATSVRSEHLLAALLSGPESIAQAALRRDGIDPLVLLRTVRDQQDPADPARPAEDDAQALAVLGIDLGEVRRQVEDVFGPGALERTRAAQSGRGSRPRWDRSAKQVLELSLREALHLRHRHIGTEHLLLGLLHPGTGAGQEALTGAGAGLETARTHVAALLRGRAAG